MTKQVGGWLLGFALLGLGLLLGACDTTGSLSGTVTDVSTHGPLAGITVEVHDRAGAIISTVTTDGAGRWTVPNLQPGDLTVRFSDPSTLHAATWFDSKPTAATATKVTISGGGAARADQAMRAPGGITGTLTDGHGPAGNVYVLVVVPHTADIVAGALTTSDGTYSVSDVAPGTYNVIFYDPAWNADQHTGRYPKVYDLAVPDLNQANDVVVGPGATTTGIGGRMAGADCDPATFKPGADLTAADLHGRSLGACDLSGAHLSGADLSGADLAGANLSGADLRGTDLTGADLTGADLSGADQTPVSLDLSPSTATPGSSVRASGSGWTNGELATLTDAATGTAICTTMPSYAQYGCAIPDLLPGGHTVVVRSLTDRYKAARTHLTTVPYLTIPGQSYTTVSVNGGGFLPGSMLTYRIDGVEVAHRPAGWGSDSHGVVEYQVAVLDPSLSIGPHVLSLTDAGGNEAHASFTVYKPTMSLGSYGGVVGSTFNVRGAGWQPGSADVSIGGVRACSVSVAADGSIDQPCTVPAVAGGLRAVRADAGYLQATTWAFRVSPGFTEVPRTAMAGSRVSLSAGGFSEGSTATLTLDGVTISSIATLNGTVPGWAPSIPSNTPEGEHTLTLSDGSASTSAPLRTTTPRVTVSASAGSPGDRFTASISGWAPSQSAILSVGSTYACSISADAAGNGSSSCAVPHLVAGSHPMTATDLYSGVNVAVADFTVTSALSVYPPQVRPYVAAQTLWVSGTGFGDGFAAATLDGGPASFSATVGPNGDLASQRWVLPATTAGGLHTLVVTDATGASASNTFMVATPTLAVVGNRGFATFSLSGSGWPIGDHLAISNSGTSLCSAAAGPTGDFSTSGCTAPTEGSFSVQVTSVEHGTSATLVVPALPAATVSPALRNVAPGSYVDISGTGFVPSSRLVVAIDGTPVPSVSPSLTSSPSGTFSARLVVPDVEAGHRTVTVADAGGHVGSMDWTVYRPSLSYSASGGAPSDHITVSIVGWVPTTAALVYIDGSTSACAVPTDGDGAGSASCVLPADLSTGPVPVVARNSSLYAGGDSTAVVALGPDLVGSGSMILPSSKFMPGQAVPFSGTGFAPGSPVTLTYYGNVIGGPVNAGVDGSVSGMATMPSPARGSTTIVLADGQGHQLTQRISFWSPTMVPSAISAGPGIVAFEPQSSYVDFLWPDRDRVVVTITDGTSTVTCSGNSNRWVGGCRLLDLPAGTYTVTARLAHSPYVVVSLPSTTVP